MPKSSATRVAVRIRDNGRGIERDAIDRVFDLFMQIDPNAGSALGGLGVGLALVRRIVELHGGSVQAISDGLGQGQRIRGAPAGRRHACGREPRGEPVPLIPDQSPPLRVLVIDDNKDAADSFCMLMKSMGHERARRLRRAVGHRGGAGVRSGRRHAGHWHARHERL